MVSATRTPMEVAIHMVAAIQLDIHMAEASMAADLDHRIDLDTSTHR